MEGQPFVCGSNCFRYVEKKNALPYDKYHCYAGSGQGANVALNCSCAFGFTTASGVDPNLPAGGLEKIASASKPE